MQVCKGESWLNVLPVPMRLSFVRDLHQGLGHCGRDKLINALQLTHWWPGLCTTITEVLTTCPACQPEHLPRPPREEPRFTNTTAKPCQGWSIDLAGPFPQDEQGNTYLAVAVCVMSKWVEARPILSKHAFRTADWLFSDIIARWGRPQFIRSDNGSEWQAEFA